MKKEFCGHFPLTADRISELIKDAIFVFDTNVLLNMYRYTHSTRDQFFNVLKGLDDRIAIPYQVAHEFFTNRINVIQQQNKSAKTMETALRTAHNKVKAELEPLKRHSHINLDALLHSIERAFSTSLTEVEELIRNREPVNPNDDPILDQLAGLLDGKIEKKPDAKMQKNREEWATSRLQQGRPPGFADKQKSGNKALGDPLIWGEIIEIAKAKQRPIIFVTDDVKDDWWLRAEGAILGPLPELRQELMDESGQEFHMYQAEQFLSYVGKALNNPVEASALQEAADVRTQTYATDLKDYISLLRMRLQDIASQMGNYPPGSPEREELFQSWKYAHISLHDKLAALDPQIKTGLPELLERQLTGEFENERESVAPQYWVQLLEFSRKGDGTFVPIASRESHLTSKEVDLFSQTRGPVWLERLDGYFRPLP